MPIQVSLQVTLVEIKLFSPIVNT